MTRHDDSLPPHQRPTLPVFDLGVAPYAPVQDLQRRLRDRVADGDLPGMLLLLEHEPVITLGTRAGEHDLRMPRAHGGTAATADASASAAALPGATPSAGMTPTGATPPSATPCAEPPAVEIVESERGGQATLHAPGQLVSYPIVPIPGHDLSAYVRGLEEVLIVLLAGLGIIAVRHPGAPGLYVAGDKIASVGLRCRRWVASHGTSLNVDVDLSLFDLIVSCGDPGLRQTSIKELTGGTHPMADIKARYLDAATSVFGWSFFPVQQVSYDRVEALL